MSSNLPDGCNLSDLPYWNDVSCPICDEDDPDENCEMCDGTGVADGRDVRRHNREQAAISAWEDKHYG